MNFNLTEEQHMLQDSLRRFLANEYGFDKRRDIVAGGQGVDKATWNAFAEMGLLGYTLPEEYDGLGGNGLDTMLVMENFGRALVVEPYLSTVVLGGSIISEAGSDEQKQRILPKIATGEEFLAFAHYEPSGRHNLDYVRTEIQTHGDDYILNGRKTAVFDAAGAHYLIVSGRRKGRPTEPVSLFLVNHDSSGVEIEEYTTHDGHRVADVILDSVMVSDDDRIGGRGQAMPIIEKGVDRAIAALCAEAVGAMEALNETTREYVQTRQQFGMPIGKFQVIQHKLADMFIATEQARSMAILAASESDSDDRDQRRRAVSMAKALVGQSARFVGQTAVQLHGGMGVTDEMFAAHLFKRLTLINLQFGDADYHLGQVSDGMLKSA
ncbi:MULTISPECIES: acyl-CoA dehydrogenase family protein [Marinobacter]|uniref:acyl-CoA dehydrogenase family protein n=1 Tax=Marinobacter TaxID=2742 RepID=UPI000DAC252C|nr:MULTISPECIES: acyl-CoA dehydrogenase [Marinobacter]